MGTIKKIKGGLTPNADHLAIAREIFSTELEPDVNCIPMPLMLIHGNAAKYGGDYTKYYTPLDGCCYINFVPEEYNKKTNPRVFNMSPLNWGDTVQGLYVKWFEDKQCIELANIVIKGKRPDKKLNQDIRAWRFNSVRDEYYLDRIVIFPNDAYAYFRDENINEGCGKYYNQYVGSQINHSLRYMVNCTWATRYLKEAVTKYITASGKTPEGDHPGIWDFLHVYKTTIERKTATSNTAKETLIESLNNKLIDLNTLNKTQYPAIVYKTTSSYSFSSTAVDGMYLYVDTIDDENFCIRIFDSGLDSFAKSLAADSLKPNEYTKMTPKTIEERYRVWYTSEGISYYNVYSDGKTTKDTSFSYYYKYLVKQDYLTTFNHPVFRKWDYILNNPNYSNGFRIKLWLALERFPIMKQIFDEGFASIGQYIAENGTPNTILNNLFNVESTSKDLYKHVPFTKEQITKMLEKSYLMPKGEDRIYSRSPLADRMKTYMYVTTKAPYVLQGVFGDKIKTMPIDKFEDYYEKVNWLYDNESYNQSWKRLLEIDPQHSYYETRSDLTKLPEIHKLFDESLENFKQITHMIKAVNRTYDRELKEKAINTINIYDASKIQENANALKGLGINLK